MFHFLFGFRFQAFQIFVLKTLTEVQLKCEMCDLYSYAEIFIDTDMLAFCF